jgi:penicillin-binding protein 2
LASQDSKSDEKCREIGIEKENIDLVKAGMSGACSTGGTGFTFFDFEQTNPRHIKVACKTGTAETGVNDKSHAWFTVFAPINSPEIVATVLVEEGGEGSSVAGPIARAIFDYYFK